MKINDRIRLIRGETSQEKFGEKIGVSKPSVSNYETGKQNVPDRVISDICREFGVNTLWLREGVGEMRNETDDDLITRIDVLLAGENETAKALFRALARLTEDDWIVINKLIETLRQN